MARLEVKTARGYWKRIRLLYLLWCGPFGVLAIYAGIRELTRTDANRSDEGLMMLAVGVFLLAVPMIFVFVRRWWVQWFDEHGVTLRNGRTFSWDKFQRVDVRKRGRGFHNNYELHFEDGIANVYDLVAENRDEVRHVIDLIARGQNPFRRAS